MKNWASLFFACLLISSGVQAQICTSERYQKQVFQNIKVSTDLKFAEYPSGFPGINNDLELDFYEPAPNDEYLGKRPLVIMLFGGAYILGDKGDADVTAWCDSLAHYGYACASVNYRLSNAASLGLPGGAERAAYAAVQDARAAIRFLLEDPNNFGFNVDPNHIYTGGESAGAITAIHTAYLEENERPPETYQYLLQPDMGCIDCHGNNYIQPFKVKGIIDLWGATTGIDLLDAHESIPMVIIHGTNDDVVPFTSGKPFTDIALTFPDLYGAQPMHDHLDSIGVYNEFYPYPGLGHVFYGTPTILITFPNQYWEPVFNQGHKFLYKTMEFDSPTPSGNLSPCYNDTELYTVSTNPGSSYCWEVTGGTIITNSDSSIVVVWDDPLTPATISVTEQNCVDVIGATITVPLNVSAGCLVFQLSLWLDGPYNQMTGLMKDDLRLQGLIPTTEPYTNLGYSHVLNGGGETIDPSVLAVTGPDAIVDWLYLELRDPIDLTWVKGTKCVLLQADGDVVDLDGVSSVTMRGLPAANYYITVKHRNHLSVMTPGSLNLSSALTPFNFKSGSAYGNLTGVAQKQLSAGVYGLFAGDVNHSTVIEAGDRSMAWNTRNQTGYLLSDANMDGVCNAGDRSRIWNNRNFISLVP